MIMDKVNTTTLAYIGDGVYELYVREHLFEKGLLKSDMLHRTALNYVSAENQAKAIKKVLPLLSEREQALVKRARNHKSLSRPKNSDPIEYKWATALEALVGYLYLIKEEKRLEEVLSLLIGAIEA